jgi:uncharacterized glyoxalase superfamily protein PhnB
MELKVEKDNGIRYLCTFIFVKDIDVSKKFYSSLLKRKIVDDHGHHVIFKGGLALLDGSYAQDAIFGEKKTVESFGRNNIELYFEACDLDSLFTRLMKEGISFVHPIREQAWGQRVFRLYDPDHHLLEIGEPMSEVVLRYRKQGMNPEEISKKTSMAINTIVKIFEKKST